MSKRNLDFAKVQSGWPSFTQGEVDAVVRVLQSNKVNYWKGEEARNFEREYAAWVGTRHAVGLANGTVVLDVALKALDIRPGDEVVVTPRTFIASISCVVNAGARQVFADVDADSGNISATKIAPFLRDGRDDGSRRQRVPFHH